MSNGMKYIIFKGFVCEHPLIFSPLESHYVMAEVLKYMGTPVSAGFLTYDMDDGDLSAHGESTSLKIKSRPQDTEIIERFLSGQ
jgi:hypothetical protein